ncbi:thioesterase family protein [Dyella sp. A6]|uniref:acyl-CoA thioesterase n=1 Tax=Dyella aluminiiresistens TaxID=3069105 RepID=UPI002E76B69C|nr:thioesterase family protein [Dyella sp. A6]
MSTADSTPPKPTRRRKAATPAAKASASPATTQPAAVAAEAATQDNTAKPLYVAELTARWRDLDAFNHVNNSNYLTYLEEARLQWLSHVPGPWFDDHAMPVMAAAQLNYRRPIEWPAQLQVELFCERMGNSSMTIAHRLVDAEDSERLYCDGHVVMVWMDPATGRPVPLPESIREIAG